MKRRTAWATAGAVLFVVVAGLVLGGLLLRPDGTPADVAGSYLDALASGDGAAAVSLLAEGAPPAEAFTAAFAGAAERVQDPAVDAVAESGATAVATVSYRLGDERTTADLDLSKTTGRWLLIAPAALGAVQADPALGSHVAIGAAVLPSGDPIRLLPAVYRVDAAPAELVSGSATAVVTAGGTSRLPVPASLKPAATARAGERLHELLATCTSPATAVPDGCGISIPWAADLASVTDIRYRVEREPELTVDGSSFLAASGVLVATVTGRAPDGAEKSVTYRTEDWSVPGDVTFTADDIQLSPW